MALRRRSAILTIMTLLSLGSGSSGNAYYIQHNDFGLLVDAGVGIRAFKQRMQDYGFSPQTIKAILLTHDHLDHTRAVGPISQKLKIPVYALDKVHEGIRQNPVIKRKVPSEQAVCVKCQEKTSVGPFEVTSFKVPHDSSDCCGYLIEFENVKLCIATDVGHITPDVENALKQATHVIIESNYDPQMLREGNYPEYLKERIFGPNGHLSNEECGRLLRAHVNPNVKSIWLCHLSENNNTHVRALNAVNKALEDLQLCCTPQALNRREPTGPFKL